MVLVSEIVGTAIRIANLTFWNIVTYENGRKEIFSSVKEGKRS